ncbi:MAG: hypothetical protein HY244_15280 [Rhizobiales bacterium]|nr:hypothetical protein [Hyphomicrobiales bacterium]
MALYRQLREAKFDQSDIDRMAAAYEAALQLLRLNDSNDKITELIAAKIIQVARLGESDPPRICARALKELGIPLPE